MGVRCIPLQKLLWIVFCFTLRSRKRGIFLTPKILFPNFRFNNPKKTANNDSEWHLFVVAQWALMATIYQSERHLLVRFWWLWWWQYLQWWDRKSSSSSPRWSKKIIARWDQWLGGESLEWNGCSLPEASPGATVWQARPGQSGGKCWVGDTKSASQPPATPCSSSCFKQSKSLYPLFPVCCCQDLESLN